MSRYTNEDRSDEHERIDVEAEELEEPSEQALQSDVEETCSFMPLFIMGTWETQSWEKRVSVAVLMPSGIVETTDDHTLRVSDDGNYLELSVKWSQSMTDPDVLHRLWTGSRMHSICVEGSARATAFRPMLRSLRNNSSQPISSTCKIKLRIPVKTNVNLLRERMIEYIRPAGTN